MSCCCPHARSASRVFSFFARRYRKRFERKGFEPSQKNLIAGLEQVGLENADVLEIGSGVGYLHQSLLHKGAASAVGIDLAPDMIHEARRWAHEQGLSARTRYLIGDFLTLQDEIPEADVTVLDKVVCCYPDAQGLVQGSLAKTRRVYALTYPRDRWYTHLGAWCGTVFMRILRSDFRPYVHDPVQVEAWISAQGFAKRYEVRGLIWLTQVYAR